MNTSPQIDALSAALVEAQKSLDNPIADERATVNTKTGGSYSYKYLSLPALIDSIRDVLENTGLAVLQEVTQAPGGIGVTTRLVHSSGQWIESGPLFVPASGSPQDYGSSITYARRYSLAAALCLAADEDDDAQRAKPNVRASGEPPSVLPSSGPGATKGHIYDAGPAGLEDAAGKPIKASTPTSVNGEGTGEGGEETAGGGTGADPIPAPSDFRFVGGQYDGWLCSEVAEVDSEWLRDRLRALKPEDRAFAEATLIQYATKPA